MKPALRKPLLWLHTWAGLVLGAFLTVTAVTGAILVFRPALERRVDARRFVVEPGAAWLSLDEIVARARAAHPASKVESVRFFGDPTMPVMVYFVNEEYVHVHPGTGEVLGVRSRYGEGFGWITGLHKYFHLPHMVGEKLTGVFALVFAGIIATGAMLWWPATWRVLRAGLTVNRRLRGRPWNLGLHKAAGAYAMAVLFFSAVTGAIIAFEPFQGTVSPPPRPVADGRNFAGFEPVAREVRRLMPGAAEYFIGFPAKGIVNTYAIAADAPHPNARSYAWFHPVTVELLGRRPNAEAPFGYRLHYWLLSLHTAMAGGPAFAMLLLLGALSVPVLAYTGLMSYLGRGRTTSPPPVRTPTALSP